MSGPAGRTAASQAAQRVLLEGLGASAKHAEQDGTKQLGTIPPTSQHTRLIASLSTD